MKRAILHKGFAIVDIFQPCISFNKINTFQWFKENTYKLPDDYDASNRTASFAKAIEEEPFPLGVIYETNTRKPFEENLDVFKDSKMPLYKRNRDMKDVEKEIMKFI